MDINTLIKTIAPKALSNYTLAFAQHNALFDKYGINTNLRLAHFLAQVMVESQSLTLIRENMNYSAARLVQIFGVGVHSAAVTPVEAKTLAGNPQAIAERVYGLGDPIKAKELGNTRPGDGWIFRGNGPLQNTGGWWHKHVTDILAIPGVDFYANPDLVADAQYILLPALIAWDTAKCNAMADLNQIRNITKAINGGYNGYQLRVNAFNKIWPLMGAGVPSWQTATPDAGTIALQQTLQKLGYKDVAADGKFGPITSAAIKDFQTKNHIVTATPGVVDAATTAALNAVPDRDGSQAIVPPPPVVEDVTVKNIGVTTATIGGAGQTIITTAGQYVNSFDSLPYIKAVFAALIVVGILLFVLPIIKGQLKQTSILQ
jgi:putative chitinase